MNAWSISVYIPQLKSGPKSHQSREPSEEEQYLQQHPQLAVCVIANSHINRLFVLSCVC